MNNALSIRLANPPARLAMAASSSAIADSKKNPDAAKSSQVPEKSILERIAAGDKTAVKECIDTYGGLIWSLARRFLANQTDAEDAVQEIFISIWSIADKYDRTIASEAAFISMITRRRLIDRLRKSGRRPVTESLDSEDSNPPDPVAAGSPEESAEVDKVAAVLAALQPEYTRILSMSLYEGYSHSEIASRLQLPLGTVKTRVRRGLIKIREELRLTAHGHPDLLASRTGNIA